MAINIPSRTDKRDQLVLGSSLTGFVIDFIDGVNADEINPKTYPYVCNFLILWLDLIANTVQNWNQEHSATEYACLRAHLNAAQKYVTNYKDRFWVSANTLPESSNKDFVPPLYSKTMSIGIYQSNSSYKPLPTLSEHFKAQLKITQILLTEMNGTSFGSAIVVPHARTNYLFT